MSLVISNLEKKFSDLLRPDWGKQDINKYVGHWTRSYFSYARDENVRQGAASGGTTTAFLSYLLQAGEIDGALVCGTDIVDGKFRPRFFIAKSHEELVTAQGSKYISVNFIRDALPLIAEFDGTLAVVGLPCDVANLQRYRQRDAELDKKVKLVIGMFCGHNSLPELTDSVIEKLRPQGAKLVSFRHRKGHWRGELAARFDDGSEVNRPFSFFSLYQNLYFFAEKKCRYCHDHTAYNCDVSVGDIWSLAMKSNPIKHTALICRNEKAIDLVRAAHSAGFLYLEERPIDEICDGQARTMPYHYNVSARLKAGKLFGDKAKDVVNERVSILDFLVSLMLTANEYISRTAFAYLVLKIPRIFLKAYLYFIKGLETLSILLKPGKTSTTEQLKIGIVGGTIWGNRGAESMLATVIGKLKVAYPTASFNIFSYYPDADAKLNKGDDVYIFKARPLDVALSLIPFSFFQSLFRLFGLGLPRCCMPKNVKALAECDVFLDVAGISFCDGREIFLLYNVLSLLPAFVLKVPVVKLAQAMGPFKNPINRIAAGATLPRCKQLFSRGAITDQNLKTLSFLKNWQSSADIAFLFEDAFALSNENLELVESTVSKIRTLNSKVRGVITISPSSLVYKKTDGTEGYYFKKLKLLASELLKNDFLVVLLPNSTRASVDKTRNNDIKVIKELAASIGPIELQGNLITVDYDLNTAAIRKIIAMSDVLVTSRFHAMISGLCLHVPTLVLGWSHKYEEVLSVFHLESLAVDYSKLDQALLTTVTKLFDEKGEVKAQIASKLENVKAASELQFTYLKELLGEPR